MALVGALCAGLHAVAGFTNRSLRARVSCLLGVPYSMGQMWNVPDFIDTG
jgi:hypothetical protein